MNRAIAACLMILLGLAACEKSQIVSYKQGEYRGKADSLPWDNERFKGDQVAWQKAIKDRNQGQNEYRRVN